MRAKTKRTLQGYDEAFAWCRTFGHSWEQWGTDHKPTFGYYESVRCGVCTTERLFTIALSGKVIARWYIYPDGYHDAKGITRQEFRQWLRAAQFFDEAHKQRKTPKFRSRANLSVVK